MLCGTSGAFYVITHRAFADGVSLFFAFLCFALFVNSLEAAASRRNDLLLAVVLALSFYAKNFFVVLVVAPAIVVFLVFARQWRRLLVIAASGVGSFVLLVVPWCVALYRRGGLEYLRIVFYDNTLGRFLTLPGGLRPDVKFYGNVFDAQRGVSRLEFVPALGLHALPWIGIVACAVWVLFREAGGPRRWFLRTAFVSVLAVVTFSSSRAMTYYLPIVPVCFLIVGEFFHDLRDASGRPRVWQRRIVAANLVAVALVWVLAPIAVAVVLEVPPAAWITGPALLAAIVLAWRSRGSWTAPRTAVAWIVFSTVMMTVTLAVAVPRIDDERSMRPFFDEVQRASEGRELWTGFVDDRWLPLANFYLNRRLPILYEPTDTAAILEGDAPAAVLMHTREYRQQESRLAGLSRTTIFCEEGSRPLVLVAN